MVKQSYADIRDKIAEEPQWWDECSVPRFCAFEPRQCSDIYADEAALVGIECQGCQSRFRVAFTRSVMDKVLQPNSQSLASQIREKVIAYGDPPNTDCCAAGYTMSSDTVKVLEYWHRKDFDWVRDPSLEIDLTEGWE